MRATILPGVCFLLGCVTFTSLRAGTPPPYEMPKQFSTQIETTVQGTKNTMTIYVDGNKSRAEVSVMGTNTITIQRGDLKVAYNLMTAQKQYMEIPMTDDQAKNAGSPTDPNATWESLGSESLNGRKCDKYKITTVNATDANIKTVSVLYVDSSSKLPIRAITGEGAEAVVMDYKNFKTGAPDASLFELPAGYTKFSIPAFQAPSPAGH